MHTGGVARGGARRGAVVQVTSTGDTGEPGGDEQSRGTQRNKRPRAAIKRSNTNRQDADGGGTGSAAGGGAK